MQRACSRLKLPSQGGYTHLNEKKKIREVGSRECVEYVHFHANVSHRCSLAHHNVYTPYALWHDCAPCAKCSAAGLQESGAALPWSGYTIYNRNFCARHTLASATPTLMEPATS